MADPTASEPDDTGTLIAFFMMPIEILKDLHSDFGNLIGKRLTNVILFQAGYRSGFGIIQRMQVNCARAEGLHTTLPSLWIELGLGLLDIVEATKERIAVVCSESKEAMAMGETGKPSCNLTSGYLAGVVSALLGNEYGCRETECLSAGDDECKFELTLVQKKRDSPVLNEDGS